MSKMKTILTDGTEVELRFKHYYNITVSPSARCHGQYSGDPWPIINKTPVFTEVGLWHRNEDGELEIYAGASVAKAAEDRPSKAAARQYALDKMLARLDNDEDRRRVKKAYRDRKQVNPDYYTPEAVQKHVQRAEARARKAVVGF